MKKNTPENYARKVRGSVFAAGHQALTRGILRESDVTVVSKGTQFYNANNFPSVGFVIQLGKLLKKHPDLPEISERQFQTLCRETTKNMPHDNKIVIASTPPWVDKSYMNLLEGGLIHECAHSLYTARGLRVDQDKMRPIIQEHYSPDLKIGSKIQLLQTLSNIFEDAYIEPLLIEEYGGALTRLQRVHEYVWELERARRNTPEGEFVRDKDGELVLDKKGKPIPGFQMISHVTCYLRDRIEHYLDRAPLSEYDPKAVQFVDHVFADEIKASDHTKDSYDCLDLAFRILKKISNASVEVPQKMPDQTQGQAGEGEPGEGQGSEKPSEEDGEDEQGSGKPSEEDGEDEGQGSGSGEDSEEDGEDEGQGSGSGSEDDGEDDGEDEQGSGEDSEDEDSPMSPDDLQGLEDAEGAEGMQDNQSVMQQAFDDATSVDAPPTVHPYSTENDEEIYIKAPTSEKSFREYQKMMEECKKHTVALRPRMLSFFRGQKQTRRKHRQAKGRRLGRTIAEVVYSPNPKPFQIKTQRTMRNSVVSLVLDESGSMGGYKYEARQILASLALTIGDLRVPHEIIGFTTSNNNFPHGITESDKKVFTRFVPMRYRIFRRFDEPFNVNTYRKLTETDADNLTPLPDSIEFAASRLLQRGEDQKILFVVTDGHPQYPGTDWTSQDYLDLVHKQIEEFKQMGVEVLMIGVGSQARYITQFENSLHLTNNKSFTAEFNTYLFAQMRRLMAKK